MQKHEKAQYKSKAAKADVGKVVQAYLESIASQKERNQEQIHQMAGSTQKMLEFTQNSKNNSRQRILRSPRSKRKCTS